MIGCGSTMDINEKRDIDWIERAAAAIVAAILSGAFVVTVISLMSHH